LRELISDSTVTSKVKIEIREAIGSPIRAKHINDKYDNELSRRR